MFEFVVCDDEKDFLEEAIGYIERVMGEFGCEYKIFAYEDYDKEFREYVENNKKRVIYILDIEMPSESGISIARWIRNLDKESIIIILTSHHETADEIYKGRLNILTFISKRDRREESFILALKDVIEYFRDENDILSFKDSGNDYTFAYKDILYITKDGRKTLIKTGQSEYIVTMSLDKLKNSLPYYFKQSHRSCIVNINRASKIDYANRMIYFDNGTSIDYIGDKYKKELVR